MKCFLILIAALVLAFGQAEAQHQLIWKSDFIPSINDIDIYPDGSRVVNSSENFIQVRDATDGNLIAEMKLGEVPPGEDNEVFSLDVSPDGKYIVACGLYTTIAVYDAETYEEIKRIGGFGYPVVCKFTPDSKRIIILEKYYSSSSRITVCNVETGEKVKEIVEEESEGSEHFALSPAGNYFAYAQTAVPWRVVIRDQQNYEIVAEFNLELDDGDGIDGLEITNSGEYVLVYDYNDIYVYNVISKELQINWNVVSSLILASEFKSDDHILVLIHNDGFTENLSFPEFELLRKENTLLGNLLEFSINDRFALVGRGYELSYFELDWTMTSLPVEENSDIKIYPNPALNKLIIEIPDNYNLYEVEVTISDINGKVIREIEKTITQNIFEIEIDLSAGVYFLNIESSDFNVSRKFVVE
mgnify:CR=1 FL=1